VAWVLLVAGLALLVGGAEGLVRGASSLAGRLGVPPLLIGLTIVAFGTSSPEIAVSLGAVAQGQSDVALGNAVGSNTFNVLFILGVSALVRPLIVHANLVRIDVPIMIGASIALWALLADGSLGRLDGALLLGGLIAYTWFSIRQARRSPEASAGTAGAEPSGRERRGMAGAIALIVLGLGAAVVGSRFFVQGAVSIATALGVSELVVALTIVAAGTSLPEVATSVVAAVRGQRDLAVGNVVGSNIFNALGILGLAGLAAPAGLEAPTSLLAFDLPVMLAAGVACLPIFFTGHEIRRWEGGLFLAGYALYVSYLVLDSTGHDALAGFSAIALYFALPLALLGVIGSVVNALRERRPSSG